MVEFGEILKDLRQKAGLTQKQLAQRMGITSAVVSYYELSERNPSPETLIKLAGIFHVTTDYLLGIEKNTGKFLDVSDLEGDEIELLEYVIAVFRKKKDSN